MKKIVVPEVLIVVLAITLLGISFAQNNSGKLESQDVAEENPCQIDNEMWEGVLDEDLDTLDILDTYLESYKEGFREGFSEGFFGVIEEFEDFELGFEDEDFFGEDEITEHDKAPTDISLSTLPDGYTFEEAFSFNSDYEATENIAIYAAEDGEGFLEIASTDLVFEKMKIAGVDVYITSIEEDDEDLNEAYFVKNGKGYTITSTLSGIDLENVLEGFINQ